MSQQNTFHSLTSLANASIAADHIVAYSEKNTFTWQQLLTDIHKLSEQLKQDSGLKVALACQDSYLFTVCLFACCAANKTVILPGNQQPAALAELSSHYDLLLSDQKLSSELTAINSWLIQTKLATPFNSEQVLTFPLLNLDQVQLVLFTSGSSGQAKAISKTLAQLNSEVQIHNLLWGEQLQHKRVESTVSHQHIYGLLYRILLPLCAQIPFATTNLEYPEQVLNRANNETILISSPALLKRLNPQLSANAAAPQLPMAAVFSSGGPLSQQAAEQTQLLLNTWPIEVFGSTETGGIAYRQQQTANQPWQIFPTIQIDLNPEGCLKLLSAHIDPDHWYQTADACKLLANNQFILLGRTDRIVKIEEKRVSLVEVEQRLDALEWIIESATLPMQQQHRLILVAAITLSETGKAQLESLGKGKFWGLLRQALRPWLEPIAIPRRYRVVDEIPLNSQGKRLNTEIEQLFNVDSENITSKL